MAAPDGTHEVARSGARPRGDASGKSGTSGARVKARPDARQANRRSRRAGSHAAVSNQLDRLTAFAAATGQVIWTAGPDGRFLDVASWCSYTGEREAEALGATWLQAVHPDDRRRADAAWRQALVNRDLLDCECRLRRFDGQYRDFLVRAAPLAAENDAGYEWVGWCADISEHVRREHDAQEALRALASIAEVVVLPLQAATDFSDSRLHLIGRRLADLTRRTLACAHLAIALLDHQTVRLAPLAAAGFTPDEERTGCVESLLRRASGVLDDVALARLRGGQDVLVGEVPAPPLMPSGTPPGGAMLLVPLAASNDLLGVLVVTFAPGRPCSASQRVLAVTVGKLIALVIERERLQRERAEARASARELGEAKREMDEFLSIATHELKTPLTSIRGFIQLAEQRLQLLADEDADLPHEAGDPTHTDAHSHRFERVRMALERAELQTGQMGRLINELLDASRIHASRLELRLARHDLLATVRESVEEQRLVWPNRAILLEALTDPAPAVTVVMDMARISQVLANFLTNALKYAPADQPVSVRVAVAADCARVSVHDRGPGLPIEEQGRVWDRFYRSQHVRTQHGGEGLGLGLYISRAIIERHGGRVGVESRPGEGATFYFTLPLVAPK